MPGRLATWLPDTVPTLRDRRAYAPETRAQTTAPRPHASGVQLGVLNRPRTRASAGLVIALPLAAEAGKTAATSDRDCLSLLALAVTRDGASHDGEHERRVGHGDQ